MRWRLFIEEYSPNLKYIKGEENVVADALSRLPTILAAMPAEDKPLDDSMEAFYTIMDCFGNNKDKEQNFDFHPLSYAHLDAAQQVDPDIMKELRKDTCKYLLKDFHGGGTTRFACVL